MERWVNEMRAPRGRVAGHKEESEEFGVWSWGHGMDALELAAEEGQYCKRCALVGVREVAGEEDVNGQTNCEVAVAAGLAARGAVWASGEE